MKLVHVVLNFIIFLTFCQCKYEEHEGHFIRNENFKSYDLHELFPGWQFVELNSLISTVDQVIVDENRIFVLDKVLQKIEIFDRQGRLITSINGDYLQNGNPVQPICLITDHYGKLMFYDAANQGFFFFNADYSLESFRHSEFYCHRIYKTGDGFIVFKNQNKQPREKKEYYYNILITDHDFNVKRRLFQFTIEKNLPRVWTFFSDPLNVTKRGFEFFQPLSNYHYVYDTLRGLYTLPIVFLNYHLNDEVLRQLDLTNPKVVMEEIFPNYSLINNKKLESKKWTGWRYILKNQVRFTLVDKEKNLTYCMDELKVSLHGRDLLLPFPSIQSDNYWVMVLDGQHYEDLGLKNYSNIHPIIDSVIQDGKTYLVIIEV
ncbi:MAG: 6-bladed beta-propeller [Cyclobacteriaceae bacterium]|nr:6-bladed beta-propeller [Cyclobacteriaceae bacterium]MCX7637482.1 6-bladed beta-propeller [Cyclobacteriaceae bacterium]MDW8331663.1 6-bladed beta-propeller [Cyclobacteriaceae bacterium]